MKRNVSVVSYLFFCMFLFIALAITPVSAISIGTAPGVYDLGDVEAGSNHEIVFYLISNSPYDLLVSIGYIDVHPDMYSRNQTDRYTFIPSESSQERISSWIEIKRTPLMLSPTNVRTVQIKGGGSVKANAEAKIILHIPKDADPGYHIGAINLGPEIASGTGGTGVATIGVTRFVFVFRVIGKAIRKGEILHIVGDRENERKVRVDVLFKNTGTCTINARVSSLKIFDKVGNVIVTLNSGHHMVGPGDITPIPVFWNGGGSGRYKVEAIVDYLSGQSVMQGEINIPAVVKVKPVIVPKPGKAEFPCDTLLWVVLIFIIAGLVIYYLWDSGGYRDIILLLIVVLVIILIVLFLLNCTLSLSGILEGGFGGLGISGIGIDFNVIVIIIIVLLVIYYMRE